MASKCEDVSFIGVADLAESSEHAFRIEDLLSLEEVVLNALRFDLEKATAADFLKIFVLRRRWGWGQRMRDLKERIRRGVGRESVESESRSLVSLGASDVDDTTARLAEYILWVSLLDFPFALTKPSVLAAAALVLAEWALRCEALAALARCPQKWFNPAFTMHCEKERMDAAEEAARSARWRGGAEGGQGKRRAESSVALTSWQQRLELHACLTLESTLGFSPAPYSHGFAGAPLDEWFANPSLNPSFPVSS